jgi:hypothetical protein
MMHKSAGRIFSARPLRTEPIGGTSELRQRAGAPAPFPIAASHLGRSDDASFIRRAAAPVRSLAIATGEFRPPPERRAKMSNVAVKPLEIAWLRSHCGLPKDSDHLIIISTGSGRALTWINPILAVIDAAEQEVPTS